MNKHQVCAIGAILFSFSIIGVMILLGITAIRNPNEISFLTKDAFERLFLGLGVIFLLGVVGACYELWLVDKTRID